MTDGEATGAGGVLAPAVPLSEQSPEPKQKKPSKRQTAQQAIARLKQLVQQRLAGLETQMGAIHAEAGTLETAREIGNMNVLARTLEKVLELERKDRAIRDRRRKQRRVMDDARRHALAERLERMHGPWTHPRDAQAAERG